MRFSWDVLVFAGVAEDGGEDGKGRAELEIETRDFHMAAGLTLLLCQINSFVQTIIRTINRLSLPTHQTPNVSFG